MAIPMNNYLVIAALGANHPSLLNQFTETLLQCGCNIINSRMTSLGKEFGLVALLSGNWGTIAKLEASLPTLEQDLGITTLVKRTHAPSTEQKVMTYVVHVVTIDRPGILNELSSFFAGESITVEDVSAHTYFAYTGTRMVAMTLNINISVDIHIPTLREKFMHYCDALNLDAGMEPLRD